MLTGILLGAIVILLGLLIWNDNRKDKEIKLSLAILRDMILELEARIKTLERQDFS